MRRTIAAFVMCAGVTLCAADFLTEGVDIGRTGWVKDEKMFTVANVASSKLLWTNCIAAGADKEKAPAFHRSS